MILHGNCLDKLKDLNDNSIDMILTDLPYGTTECKWDNIIPFEPMWNQIKRVTKSNAAIIFHASQPFSSSLVMSNIKWFRYDLIWNKTQPTGFYNANRMPLRSHEDILVFYNKLPTYNPQKTPGKPYTAKRGSASDVYHGKDLAVTNSNGERYPLSVHTFIKDKNKDHPTQKPVALLEYLIRTYTNKGDTVLDFTMGSGSTGVAALKTERKFIGIEMNEEYLQIAEKRMEAI